MFTEKALPRTATRSTGVALFNDTTRKSLAGWQQFARL
jgi:hypothetical protein